MWSAFARRGWRTTSQHRNFATSFRGFRDKRSYHAKTEFVFINHMLFYIDYLIPAKIGEPKGVGARRRC
jgi:hypothetical protein